MKKCFAFITLGIFLFACSAHAANLKLSESSINFGNIKEGPPVEKTITITNQGTGAVNIANTATSCACTSVKLAKTSLEPGESTKLLITYNTYKYPGKFDKTVTVFTGTDGKEETVIHLLGNVDPIPMGVIAMEPRKTDVGILKANQGNEVQIVIKNEGDAPLTISRIYSLKYKKEYYNGGDSGGIKIAAGGENKIDLVITPRAAKGILDIIMIYSDARNDDGKGYKGILSGSAI